MLKSKKGVFTLLFVWLMIILLVCIAGIIIYKDQGAKDLPHIGVFQLELTNVYNEADKIVFYLDKSLQNSFDETLNKIAENGGFYDVQGRTKNGYVIWEWNKDCYPDEEIFYDSFSKFLNEEINSYWKQSDYYEEDLEYIFEFKDDKVVGDNVILNLSETFDYNYINYTFNASLLLKKNINFDKFLDAVTKIESVSSFCGNDLQCWEEDINLDYVEINKEGDFYKFDIKLEIEDKFSIKKEVIFKGAINYAEYNPLLGDKFVC